MTQATIGFVVTGMDHDQGGKPVLLVRETLEIAYRTADLLAQCGYRHTNVSAASDIANS